MIEARVCVHDDASRWLMFVGSRGQRPPFLFFCSVPLFFPSVGICLFFVLPFSVSSLCWTIWLQSSWSSPLVSAHKPSLSLRVSKFMSCQCFICSLLSVIAFLVTANNLTEDWGEPESQSIYSACRFFLVFFIQLQIKVLWDNATVTVCLWFLRDTTAFALLLFTGNGCRETKSGPVGRLNFRARRAVYGFVWIWTNWSETDFILHASFLRSTLAREMNKFYSMQTVEPEDGTKVRESFKFVSEVKGEVKRDVWREDGGQERSEPSCCLSVSKISYTVR